MREPVNRPVCLGIHVARMKSPSVLTAATDSAPRSASRMVEHTVSADFADPQDRSQYLRTQRTVR
jgi:hypothetical protein